MKRIMCLVLVFLLFVPAALAAAIVDVVPDTSQWGFSRTKFRDANEAALKEAAGVGYTDVEIAGLKGLALPGFDIDGYAMNAYYEFAAKQGNYYGLSRVFYLLDVSKKVTDANLTKCYKALVKDMTASGKPTNTSADSSVWEYSDCTLEIAIGKYTEYNGSRNKTVAVIFSAPAAEATAESGNTGNSGNTGRSGKSKTMNVTASATCSDYNSVGEDWTQAFTVNGKKLTKTSEIELSAGDTVTVAARITETDSSPDEGDGSKSYTVTKADLEQGFTISFTVNVQENKGRYKGNTAKWSVKFTFKP